MSTFTEDFQRRLRAVLAKLTGKEIPDDAVIEVVADGASYDDSRGMDLELRIRTARSSGMFAEHIYEEPGAGARLMADLDAVGEPAPLGELTAEAADLLTQMDAQGPRRELPDNGHTKALSERGLIGRNGDYWYVTPAGHDLLAKSARSSETKTALDVTGPLSPEESDLLVALYDQGQKPLRSGQLSLAITLAERGRGLTYVRGVYGGLTALGRDAAVQIKLAAEKSLAVPPRALARVKAIKPEPTMPQSSWWAWDELQGQYLLSFRHGIGQVQAVLPSGRWPAVRRFEQGTSSHITLEAFAQHAGIDISQIPEEDRR